mgnify:FL=1
MRARRSEKPAAPAALCPHRVPAGSYCKRCADAAPAVRTAAVTEGRLSVLEAVVERGLSTFVEVGTALAEIRDSRLYLATCGTFEDYLSERWGMSRPRGYQMIEAAKVALAMSTTVDKPSEEVEGLSTVVDTPATEREARAVAPVLRSEGPEAARTSLRERRARSAPPPSVRQTVDEQRVMVTNEEAEELLEEEDRRLRWASGEPVHVPLDLFERVVDALAVVYPELAEELGKLRQS